MQCSDCDGEMRYIIRARAWYCPDCDIYLDEYGEEDIGTERDALAAKNAELLGDIVRWRRAVQTVEMERNTLSDENAKLREACRAALSFIDDDAPGYPPPGGYTLGQMKSCLRDAIWPTPTSEGTE